MNTNAMVTKNINVEFQNIGFNKNAFNKSPNLE